MSYFTTWRTKRPDFFILGLKNWHQSRKTCLSLIKTFQSCQIMSVLSGSSPSLCSSTCLSAASGGRPPAADHCSRPSCLAAATDFPWSSRCRRWNGTHLTTFHGWQWRNAEDVLLHVGREWRNQVTSSADSTRTLWWCLIVISK